ncbi:hypothetical protein TNCT_304961, partial [Trichonephila clavata]
RKKVMHLKTD